MSDTITNVNSVMLFKGFNNYFNRKIKKYSTLEDYQSNSQSYMNFDYINFNPNDGISTVLVVGSPDQKENDALLDWENNGSPDYVIYYEWHTEVEDDDTVYVKTIKSRWFVLESVRERAGQYKLALKRDIIADHLEQVLTNPCFIEKGWISDTSNPLLFNGEAATFNEIKQYELPLRDETQTPWIGVYIAKNYPTSDDQVDTTMSIDIETGLVLDPSELPFGMTSTSSKTVKGAGQLVSTTMNALVRSSSSSYPQEYHHPYRLVLTWNSNNGGTDTQWVLNTQTSRVEYAGTTSSAGQSNRLCRGAFGLTPTNQVVNMIGVSNVQSPIGIYSITDSAPSSWTNFWTTNVIDKVNTRWEANGYDVVNLRGGRLTKAAKKLKTDYGAQCFMSDSSIMDYNNRYVLYNGNYYKIKITKGSYGTQDIQKWYIPSSGKITLQTVIDDSHNSQFNSAFDEFLANALDPYSSGFRYVELEQHNAFFYAYWNYNISYELVDPNSVNEKLNLKINLLSNSNRIQTRDACYDLFALPYGAIDFKITSGGNTLTYTANADASLALARGIAAEHGSSIYDIQMLPYCPLQGLRNQYGEDEYIDATSTSNYPSGTFAIGYKTVGGTDTPMTIGVWCTNISGSFDITAPTEISGISFDDTIEYKANTACYKYRLVSPNYSGIYEFNPLKNNGITKFNVDYTYKPYNPYVHVAPFYNDGSLYGKDFNDGRGLVVSGDLSVGWYSDKWAEYQIQNANYDAIFNRQVQNLDVNNKIAYEQQQFSNAFGIASNALGMGATGAASGITMSGSPWGALAGGIIGTGYGLGSSIAAFVKDEEWLTRQQSEARSYMVDMYNLQLGNIKALPYSLAKVDALNENFKFFPFVEIYKSTDAEIEIFKNKMKYDGMTIEAIGTLANYINTGDDFTRLKGRLIMVDNVIDDFHITDAIYQEVNKGFYLMNE